MRRSGRFFAEQAVWLRYTAAHYLPEKPIYKRSAVCGSYLVFEVWILLCLHLKNIGCSSAEKIFIAFLLTSMQRYSRKSGEWRDLRWNNADLGEKSAVFSNGEKRRESGRRSVRNGLFSLLRRGFPSNGESSQVPYFEVDSRNKTARQ